MQATMNRNLRPKARRFRGQVYQTEASDMHAEVLPGEWIRIFGRDNGVDFDKTFKLGDHATYDSYNLIYIGVIEAIGPKSVLIIDEHDAKRVVNHPEKRRLDFWTFASRNKRFELEQARRHNAEELHHL